MFHIFICFHMLNTFSYIFIRLNGLDLYLLTQIWLRIHWRLSMILKTSNKSVWSNVFWYVEICIFLKCIQYTIHWDKTQMLKKNSSDKINGKKMPSFSFHELQHGFTFNLQFLYALKRKFIFQKLCVEFSIVDSVSFLLMCIFLFNNIHGFFEFERS